MTGSINRTTVIKRGRTTTTLRPRLTSALEWYHEHRDKLKLSLEATVVHEDLNLLNILVSFEADSPQISAIVDWEDITAAPPELQVESAVTLIDRQLQVLDRSTIRNRFVEEYRSERPLPIGYEQRTQLYRLQQWLNSFSNLRSDLDIASGQGAAVEQYARNQFEEIGCELYMNGQTRA